MSMHFIHQVAVRRVNEHRICMNFMLRDGWHISFLEEDCRTPLPRTLTFASPDKILEMYEREESTASSKITQLLKMASR